MRVYLNVAGTTFLFGLISVSSLLGELRIPSVFSDHMVLQRDKPIQIWGWAESGESIDVHIGKNHTQTSANEKGRWIAMLNPMSAGGPHELSIEGADEKFVRTDILVGEVWIGSGQSNMFWWLKQSLNGVEAIKNSDISELRLFSVETNPTRHPANDVKGSWVRSTPATSPDFSAVLYYFGLQLYRELGIPVGLIHSSYGGTRVEPWTPLDVYPEGPERDRFLAAANEGIATFEEEMRGYGNALIDWEAEYSRANLEGRPAPQKPREPNLRYVNGALYNGMIHPLIPISIRGAIWYQGESNLTNGLAYGEKFHDLIRGWRNAWKQGDFPFYYVQLAPFNYTQFNITKSTNPKLLPMIWEAQTSALTLPNTGMVVTTDVGNLMDIHPRNKKVVGKRLADLAMAKTYGKTDRVYSGPIYKSHRIEKNEIIISFHHIGSGLRAGDGKELSWFETAGEDRVFYTAKARIVGDEVVVSSDHVQVPVAVRFAYHESAEPNLFNREGFPAAPFRTDSWEISQ